MTVRKPQILLLSLVVAVALGACKKADEASPAAGATAQAEPAALKLDESSLPSMISFQASDLDASKNACTDFGGYANGKWLAANDIPADRTIDRVTITPGCVEGTEQPKISHCTEKEGEEPQPSLPADSAS